MLWLLQIVALNLPDSWNRSSHYYCSNSLNILYRLVAIFNTILSHYLCLYSTGWTNWWIMVSQVRDVPLLICTYFIGYTAANCWEVVIAKSNKEWQIKRKQYMWPDPLLLSWSSKWTISWTLQNRTIRETYNCDGFISCWLLTILVVHIWLLSWLSYSYKPSRWLVFSCRDYITQWFIIKDHIYYIGPQYVCASS